jgi:hypothetical protein
MEVVRGSLRLLLNDPEIISAGGNKRGQARIGGAEFHNYAAVRSEVIPAEQERAEAKKAGVSSRFSKPQIVIDSFHRRGMRPGDQFGLN